MSEKIHMCIMGHETHPANSIHTNAGLVCREHISRYRRAVHAATLIAMEDSNLDPCRSGNVNKRVKEILARE